MSSPHAGVAIAGMERAQKGVGDCGLAMERAQKGVGDCGLAMEKAKVRAHGTTINGDGASTSMQAFHTGLRLSVTWV